MCPRSTYVIVWLITSGQRIRRPFRAGAQNQPRDLMKPTRCRCAFAAIAALVRCCVAVCAREHGLLVECESRRQSVGSTVWPGGSSMTITLRDDARIAVLSFETALIARGGAHVFAQLPTIRVTSGRSAAAHLVAQRYHVRHSPLRS